jgi:hypothetical protein
VLLAYGDESHDPKNERVFAFAALFGSEQQWDTLRSKWSERLNGRVFHAADCESDQGEFSGNDHAANLRLFADLTRILAASGIIGHGSAMDLAGHREFFPDSPHEVPYYRCFKDVVYQCGKWAKWAIPSDTAQFHIDRRIETDYNARVLYGHMATMRWDCAPYLAKELEIISRSEIGIQAADLYAREVMKHLDNEVGLVKRPMRRSLKALQDAKRFGCNLHMREYFQDFKTKFDDIAKGAGISIEEYRQWLREHKQADSISSRHRFLIDLETWEAQAG